MNKSILVLDTPSSCRDCPLRFDSYGQCEICAAHEGYPIVDEYYEENTKPDWCPLKPLPSYKDLKPDNSLESQLSYQFNQGFNNCLSELV